VEKPIPVSSLMQNISASTSLSVQKMPWPTPSPSQSNFVAAQVCWSHKQQVFSYTSQPQPLPVFGTQCSSLVQ